MNFIEILKSVGGVQPCDCDKNGIGWAGEDGLCAHCHGTGQILDLAPLLAKPKELEEAVRILIENKCFDAGASLPMDVMYVAGPQRASNLVYEVARQLGGTAVVVIPDPEVPIPASQLMEDLKERCIRLGYRLSFPIPPDATVLFVTDKLDEQEMRSVIEAVAGMRVRDGSPSWKYLTYILCLISTTKKFDMPYGPHEGEWNIISLHKE